MKHLKVIIFASILLFQGPLFSEYEVSTENIEVWSDGTRMQGNLFIPQDKI